MRFSFGLIFVFVSFVAHCQVYPKNYFRHPVDGKLAIAGTFGELRSYHFHMGLDIKANEGTPVKACADGYLARIKVSENGYGKVIYINHPNGYSTVYAHLSRFSDTLNKFIKSKQYELQSEEIDLYLSDSAFKFTKGQVVAFTGNTGHSAGPHLHFEIRDAKTDEAFNPLLFGIKVKDDVKPEIEGLKFYPLDETSTVEGKQEAKYLSLKYTKTGGYKNNINIKAYGTVGIAVEAHDHTSESTSRCGIFEIQLCTNNKVHFCQRISNIGFDVTRYINTYKDFDEFHDHNRHLQKTYIKGNNKLKIYPDKDKNGFLKIEGNDTLKYYVIAIDAAGNKDSVFINIIPYKTDVTLNSKKKCSYSIDWKQKFEFKHDGISIDLPEAATYENECFNYYVKPKNNKTFSKIHAFYFSGKPLPLQEEYLLKIKADTLIPEKLVSKVLIARTRDFKDIVPYETQMVNDSFVTKPRSLGTFSLIVDTIAPTIKAIGLADSMTLSKAMVKELSFEINDDLSGIKSYKLFINDKWVLTHFNQKKNKVFFLPKEVNLDKGYYSLVFEVIDKKGNVNTIKSIINWVE